MAESTSNPKSSTTVQLSVSFTTQSTCFQVLEQLLPEQFTIGTVTRSADIAVLHEDVQRFFAFKSGTKISRTDYIECLNRCRKQKRYIRADLTLTITHGVLDGTVHCISGTILERIDIAGILIGKDKFRHVYPLKSGDLFNEEAHQAGLKKIKKLLERTGYLGAHVHNRIIHQPSTNTARITITVEPGTCYRINHASLQFSGKHESMDEGEYHKIRGSLHRSLRSMIERTSYHHDTINQATMLVRKKLQKYGFLAPQIMLKERINHHDAMVDITLDIAWGHRNVFLWYGNMFFSQAQLLDHLLNFGSSLTFIPPALLAEELVALYKQSGFWNASITWREDGIKTYFFITEGKAVKIDNITFEGVSAFPTQGLVRDIGSPVLKEPFKSSHISTFLAQLTEYYVHAGFWDVAIENYTYTPTAQQHRYNFHVKVCEGAQRWLDRIEYTMPGAPEHSIQLATPRPFDIRMIQEERQVLIRTLRKQGRIYANPVPQLYEASPHHMVLHWKCEGIREQVAFGKTIITGNGALAIANILRECTYQEGDRWNQDTLNATLSQLRGLDIFDVVSTVPDDITAPTLTKDVILQCNPDAPFELKTRLGVQGVNRNVVQWHGGASPKLGLSFLARNPTNSCDVLRADINYTRYMHDMTVTYKLPWIRHTRVGLEIQAISSRYDQPVYVGSPQVLYRASHDGFLAGIGKTRGPFTGGISLNVAQIGVKATACDSCSATTPSCSRTLTIARALDLDPLLLTSKPWYVILETTSIVDCRDDKINPHDGSLTVLALKGVVPPAVASGSYIKGILESSWFASWKDWVLGVRFRAGMIGGAHFDRIIPMDRLYLGGPYSLRCYYSDYSPPLASFLSCSGCTCLVPTGGKYMVNMNAELRFPLYKKLVGGVLFVDSGSLSCASPFTLVKPHNLMGALGCGIRINTPLGPLRGDIGWSLHRDTSCSGTFLNNRSFAWFITIGHAF